MTGFVRELLKKCTQRSGISGVLKDTSKKNMISLAGLWPSLLDVSAQMSLHVSDTVAECTKCHQWLLMLCGTFLFLDGEAEAGPQSYLCPKVTETSDG